VKVNPGDRGAGFIYTPVHSLGVAEECSVDFTKKSKIIVAVHIVISLVAIFIFLLYHYHPLTHEIKINYTPKEGLLIANDIAQDWSENASLYKVEAYPSYCHEITSWVYFYINSSEILNPQDELIVHVYENNSAEYYENMFYHSEYGPEYVTTFSNWTVDADEAIGTIWGNNGFQSYLQQAPNPRLVSLTLIVDEYDANPTWYFHFEQQYVLPVDNIFSVSSRVDIDSNTGRILNINTNGTKPFPICSVIVLIVFLVINFGFMVKLLKKRNNPPTAP
jgi:hypothetical protein